MPWKETCAMNERLGFVCEVERGERTMSELCRVFGISRKTGYKWLERYRELGEAGLEELSRAPHHHPNAMSKETATEIIRVRGFTRTGGRIRCSTGLNDASPSCCCRRLAPRRSCSSAKAWSRRVFASAIAPLMGTLCAGGGAQ